MGEKGILLRKSAGVSGIYSRRDSEKDDRTPVTLFLERAFDSMNGGVVLVFCGWGLDTS